MVCAEEKSKRCLILDHSPNPEQKKISITIRPSYTVEKLFSDVELQSSFKKFQLLTEDGIILNDKRHKTLSELDFNFESNSRIVLRIVQIREGDENIIMGEIKNHSEAIKNDKNDRGDGNDVNNVNSSNKDETDSVSFNVPIPAPPPPSQPLFMLNDISSNKSSLRRCYDNRPTSYFVGLVNQAMTCYLNSLLQALFMTPEFRNALYNWQYDGHGETKSIPYQLQRLFVNLQTSNKASVETTDLTKSFGWDSTEAWQQHDIQELCRVMFDALEQKFKNTKQADLINRLYEGKMIDYVKCLECSTEKSREDTFLDIPLPVKPFGGTVAYESIEEALSAFVQPETLNENNQYFCEKCNKKCDAHKGLKFTKFPYILTLHLKRFDFDYQTMHRIKLNDKVTFPQMLNLDSFVNNSEMNFVQQQQKNKQINGGDTVSLGHESIESAVRSDDCSTTDSGSAMEEDNCSATNFATNTNMNETYSQDDDEGIDMTTNGDNKSTASSNETTGQFQYELFAIMIHSGSASGGHYYAYIKDFETNKWYSFNDQTVSPITQDDIQRSFGEASYKTYYSGAYTSSTNAYMLMYRQTDSIRNCSAMKEDEFPEHIKNLVQKIKEKEESDRKAKETELDLTKLQIYFNNPKSQRLASARVYRPSYTPFEEILEEAYKKLNIKLFAPIERCRLVAFDHDSHQIERSLDDCNAEEVGIVMNALPNATELLLEMRDADKPFEEYQPNSIQTKYFKIDMNTSDIDGPYELRVPEECTILEYKKKIAEKFKLNANTIILALENYNNSKILNNNEATLRSMHVSWRNKLYITSDNALNSNDETNDIIYKKFQQIICSFEDIATLYFLLPQTDKMKLEQLSIPYYSSINTSTNNNIKNNNNNTNANPEKELQQSNNNNINLNERNRFDNIYNNYNGTGDNNNAIGNVTPTVPFMRTVTKEYETSTCSSTSKCHWRSEFISEKISSTTSTANYVLSLNSNGSNEYNHYDGMQTMTTSIQQSSTVSSSSAGAGVGITSHHQTQLHIQPMQPLAGECNSEDSSLSDSDKTLIDTKQHDLILNDDNFSRISSTNNSPASRSDPQLSSPDESSNRCVLSDNDGDNDIDMMVSCGDGYNSRFNNDKDDYFKAVMYDEKIPINDVEDSDAFETQKILKVLVNKAMTIADLKKKLQSYVNVPMEYFKLFRIGSNSTGIETELTNLTDKLSMFKDGERVNIELGRALRIGEYKCKLYYFKLSEMQDDFEKAQYLCEFIIRNDASVGITKREIVPHIATIDPKYNLAADQYALRRKPVSNIPSNLYTDEMKFGEEIRLTNNLELYIQELEENSPKLIDYDANILFIRRVYPSTKTLGKFEEIVLQSKTELKSEISKLSQIPVERISYIKSFTNQGTPIVKLLKCNRWLTVPMEYDNMNTSVRDGDIYYYRDSNEKMPELTNEEIQDLSNKEKATLTSSSIYSPRRERALKIYVDSSPKKCDDIILP